MQAQIKVGGIAGISIGLHYSWFIIAVLITLSLAGHFHSVTPRWSDTVVWSSAIITGLLFFAALLLHEMAHSLVAKAYGLKVRSITLFALGGVSQIESEASDAKSEFWIAIAGPLASARYWLCFSTNRDTVRLAARKRTWYSRHGCGALARLHQYHASRVQHDPRISARWRSYLAGYHLGITHNADRSTRLAAQMGQAVAFIFIMLGLYRFFAGANFGGLWLAFIGWFLLDASRRSYVQVELMEGLRGRPVADIMDRDCPTVEGHLSLQDFVQEYLLRSGRRCFAVVQNGRLSGLVTPSEVERVERERWAQTSVQAVMRPLSQLPDNCARHSGNPGA